MEDAQPVPSQFEQFEPRAVWARAAQQRLHLTRDPAYRLKITSGDGNRMIQVQNSRLISNWLGKGGDSYPRYKTTREEFREFFRQFKQFLEERQPDGKKLGEIRPNQWEVTYLNRIPQESVWKSLADWSFFRPLGSVPTIKGLIEAESFGGQWHFRLPEQRGRLHIEWEHGREERAGGEEETENFVRLTLTARGPIDPSDGDDLMAGLDRGRATIVRTFRELMSDEANRIWGLSNDTDAV